jgi:hypothetical protein
LVWRKKAPPHLHINVTEAWALWMAVYKAPEHSIIFCDSRVAIHWPYRSQRPMALMVNLAIRMARKDIRFMWVPSALNPADRFTR